MKPLSLYQRCENYNAAYAHLPHQQLHVTLDTKGEEFASGFWFCGGGNVSSYPGSYQTEYVKRMDVLFADAFAIPRNVVHLFSGSLPPSPRYTRVGIDFTGSGYKSDLEIDVNQLSSRLPFKPSVIFADPPYSDEESGRLYNTSLINGERVLEECWNVLKPNGYIIWMDRRLPLFSNDKLRLSGCISYIRSTGNGFRCVTIYKKVS